MSFLGDAVPRLVQGSGLGDRRDNWKDEESGRVRAQCDCVMN